jgi:two-component system sensor histidine kinase UhpB
MDERIFPCPVLGELATREQALKAFFAASPTGLSIIDSQLRFMWINQALAEFNGLSVEEHLGKTIREATPRIAPTVEPVFRGVLSTGQPVSNLEIGCEMSSQPGVVRTFVQSYFPILDAAGSTAAVGVVVVEITPRVRAEEELRKQTEILQKIFDHAPVMISFTDQDGRIKLINRERERTLGWTQEEIEKGVDVLAECYPDPRYREELVKAFTVADGTWADFKARTKDGRTIDTRWARVRLSDGSSVGIGSDVTERNRAERALREEKDRAQKYLDIAGVMLLAINSNQEVVLVNSKGCEILGYTREEIIGRRWCDNFIPTRERDWLNRVLAQLVAGDIEPVEYVEYPVLRKTGEERLIAWHNTVLRDESARVVASLSSGEDITDRRRAEEELRKAEEQFRNIFDQALEGIYRSSPEGRALAANPAFAKMLGYDSAQDLVSSVTDAAHQIWVAPADRLRYTQQLEESEIIRGYESQLVRKDGIKIWVSANCRRVAGPDGNTLYFEGFVEDITERKRAEKELQRSFEQLRALAGRLQSAQEEERKRVAREIHDDLGQLLTATKMELDSVLQALPPDKEPEARRVKAAMKLVDQTVQSVRRIAAELRPSMLDDLGLEAALEWAAEDFQARTGTPCSISLPEEDIAPDQEHATALFRIFQETLTNIARHAAATEVNARLSNQDGVLLLEVRDNGKGVKLEQLSAPTSLGILGMRERALLLGGDLTITGAPGQGTMVSARIPVGKNRE